MANHPSAEKRHRQSAKRAERNRVVRSRVRTTVKRARTAIESGDVAVAAEEVARAARDLDKAATAAVAGMRIPPVLRRSPSESPSRTSTRSCRSLIGTDPSARGVESGVEGLMGDRA